MSELVFVAFLLLCTFPLAKSDEMASVLAFRSAVGGTRWNQTESNPCKWHGIHCQDNHITVLRLPAFGLTGQIPFGTIANLTHLHTLSLRFNSLAGRLPSDLSLCSQLRHLYLQGNHFSGEIPAFIFTLHHLVRLNLAGNNFSGSISPNFNHLTDLETLFLEKNELSGHLPELNLPNLVQLNVSYNRLQGLIPLQLQSKKADCFRGNLLCGGPVGPCPENPKVIVKKKDENRSRLLLCDGTIAGILSVFGIFLLLGILAFLLWGKKGEFGSSSKKGEVGKASSDKKEEGSEKESETMRMKMSFFVRGGMGFELEELWRSSAEVLGMGWLGTVYKAVLENGVVVAVKRLKDVMISKEEFREMVEVIGSMDHENLVPIRAYYYSTDEKLLVYDYMPMGSLYDRLHGNRRGGMSQLSWETRVSIALGAARGIEYLHCQGPNVSHSNIKSSNILLSRSYDARVSDFSLTHLVGPSSSLSRVGENLAPEVIDTCRISQKADVYSFGIILLELLTGKAPTAALLNADGVDLPTWAQSVLKEEWASKVLLRYHNVEEDMIRLLQLAIDCLAQYPERRPTMSEVVHKIEEICLCHSSSSEELQNPQPFEINNVR